MKENKKAKKVVALLLCAVLLVVGSVSATVAYLTDSKSVTNTFTVGKVAITLDEAKVNEYGVAQGGRSETGFTYKLIPGHEYTKDPVIHFEDKSEASYLFVEVDNQIAGVEIADADGDTIHEQIIANGWIEKTAGIYYKEVGANTTGADVDYKVFEKFTIKGSVENTELESYAGKKIIVTAYAIQKDGLDVNAAWNALNP